MNLYNKLFINFKEEYILFIPLSIIFQSCLGSIAAMYILRNHLRPGYFFELILCVILAMIYNGAIYAQLKIKWVFNLLLITLITDVILIAINL